MLNTKTITVMKSILESEINFYELQGYVYVGKNTVGEKVFCLYNRYFVKVNG